MSDVLLWGTSGDPPLMALLDELDVRGAPYHFIDQRRMHRTGFDFEAQGMNGWLQSDERRIDLAAVRALYARPNDVRRVLHQERADQAQRNERQLYAWADMTTALVLNRPAAASSNDSKPYQLERIHAAGFAVPPTLITTSPSVAREFVATHGEVVCKAAGRTRSIVSRLTASDLERIEEVSHCPTLFQAFVAGVAWRVHVIGAAVFACEIRCAADDYRIAAQTDAALEITAAELPAPVAAQCRSLLRSLGLTFAGIDLRRAGDDWYCFEVNPSPLFTYFEQAGGQRLTAAIADLLLDAAPIDHYGRSH
jgi:glutathione synthase/RimK-type ligase-like ATP-grasp enzyme